MIWSVGKQTLPDLRYLSSMIEFKAVRKVFECGAEAGSRGGEAVLILVTLGSSPFPMVINLTRDISNLHNVFIGT